MLSKPRPHTIRRTELKRHAARQLRLSASCRIPITSRHSGAGKPAVAQVRERPIGLAERVGGGRLGVQRVRPGKGKKFLGIFAREIGDGAQHAFPPQEFIRKRRDIAHVDAAAHHRAARADGGESQRHQRAHRREDDRRIKPLRRPFRGIASPFRAHFQRKLLRLLVAWRDQPEHTLAAHLPDLRDQVSRCPETIKTELVRRSGHLQAAPADQAGAHQRGRGLVGIAVGHRKHKTGIAIVSVA
jgi:hypothetical protein